MALAEYECPATDGQTPAVAMFDFVTVVLIAVPLYRNMTPYGLVHNCLCFGEADHVFRVAQRDLDQFTRRRSIVMMEAVHSSETLVAKHGVMSPRASIFGNKLISKQTNV